MEEVGASSVTRTLPRVPVVDSRGTIPLPTSSSTSTLHRRPTTIWRLSRVEAAGAEEADATRRRPAQRRRRQPVPHSPFGRPPPWRRHTRPGAARRSTSTRRRRGAEGVETRLTARASRHRVGTVTALTPDTTLTIMSTITSTWPVPPPATTGGGWRPPWPLPRRASSLPMTATASGTTEHPNL